ncbi:MAG: DUF3786 domain-containing protein [Desulfopila sp.]
MKHYTNALEIFNLTPQSNCRECHQPTCLAFAGAVYTGKKKLSDCPYISTNVLAQYEDMVGGNTASIENVDMAMQQLQKEVAATDLRAVAQQLGGTYNNGRLTLKILGKSFSIDDNGDIHTLIHANPWVVIPVYNYILRGGKRQISGRWVPLRELPNGKEYHRLFGQRCEKPMKNLADNHPGLFEDIIRLFDAHHVDKHFSSDISVVLYPLPKVPMLICYWYADGEMDSDLHLFFDETADDYLDGNSLNSIGSGFVTMLEKLIQQHS